MDIDPGRLIGLTDGIFGMVMTLLVFGMALPQAHLITEGQFITFLNSIAHSFGLTIVSFILVSSFWIYHVLCDIYRFQNSLSCNCRMCAACDLYCDLTSEEAVFQDHRSIYVFPYPVLPCSFYPAENYSYNGGRSGILRDR